MKRHRPTPVARFLAVSAIALLSSSGTRCAESGRPLDSRPNIVLILTDDQGWGDITCYHPESRIVTPNMDRLASQGMRLLNAYTPASVCSPTRYGLLTGRYPWRTPEVQRLLRDFP